MTDEGRENGRRSVLVQTVRGTVEGELFVSTAARTLDGLNMLRNGFVTIEKPVVTSGEWTIDSSELVLNMNSILFVVEQSSWERGRADRGESARFSRSAVRLQIGEFLIEGFLHVPGSGRPLARLKQDRHSFLAITSASVSGPDALFASPFVAVNRSHILAAQELLEDRDPERIEPDGDEPQLVAMLGHER